MGPRAAPRAAFPHQPAPPPAAARRPLPAPPCAPLCAPASLHGHKSLRDVLLATRAATRGPFICDPRSPLLGLLSFATQT